MKSKNYVFLIFLVIFISSICSTVYAKHIKPINELSINELIEYGRQIEKNERERKETLSNTQIEANNKFNALIQQENKDRTVNVITSIILICFIFTIIILSILLYRSKIKHK